MVIEGRMRERRFGPLSLIDRLFGYDFFLSYSHSDGQNYVLALKRALEAKRFRVCVDLSEFSVGDSIGEITQRRLKMSRRLVLICRPAAVVSKYVRQEVETFVAVGRRPITVDWNGTLSSENATWLRGYVGDDLFVAERSTEIDGAPSSNVVEALERSFVVRRTETIRTYVFAAIAMILLTLATGATFFGLQARAQEKDARAGQLAAESAYERGRDPGLSIEKALCAVEQRQLSSAADALVAATRAAGPVEVFLALPGDQALDVGFLPNPERVVVTTEQGNVSFLDVQTGQRSDLHVFDGRATSLGIDPRNSSRIIVGSGAGGLAIVDVASQQIQPIEGPAHQAGITGIIDLDGQHFATVAWDNNLRIWSYATRRAVCIPPPAHIAGNVRTGINGVAFDVERRLLYTVGADGTIGAWDVASPSECRLLASNPAKEGASSFDRLLWSVAVDPRSGLLAVGSYSGAIRLYRFDRTKSVFDEAGEAGAGAELPSQRLVSRLAFNEQGDHLAVARWDSTLTWWNISPGAPEGGQTAGPTSSPLQAWRALGVPISGMSFSPDGRRLAATGGEKIVLWDVGAASTTIRRPLSGNEVRTTLARSGSFAVSWNENNLFAIVRLTGRFQVTVSGRAATAGRIVAGAVSDDGRLVALGTEFGEIELHNGDSVLVNAAAEQDSEITALAFSGDTLLSGRRDGKLIRFSAKAKQLLGTPVYQHASAVGAIAASPKTGDLASSPFQTGPIVVQRLHGSPRIIPFEPGEAVRGLNFSRGGQSLAIASSRGRARLVALAPNEQRVEDLPDPNEQVRAVAFSSDGGRLASVNDGTAITVWDIRGHRRLFIVPDAAPQRTDSIAFRPDGTLVSVDVDGNLTFWPGNLEGWRRTAMGVRLRPRTTPLKCDGP